MPDPSRNPSRFHPADGKIVKLVSYNIRFGLGSPEIRAMERFFRSAHELDLIDTLPEIKMALQRRTRCHEAADSLGSTAE